MKNKKVSILNSTYVGPFSVLFVSETVRGNPSTYYQKCPAQSIQWKNCIKIGWKLKFYISSKYAKSLILRHPIHTCPNKNNQPFPFLTDMSQFPIPPHCIISHDLDLNYDTGPSAEKNILYLMQFYNWRIQWYYEIIQFFQKYDIYK